MNHKTTIKKGLEQVQLWNSHDKMDPFSRVMQSRVGAPDIIARLHDPYVDRAALNRAGVWTNQPWVTPIIGSGPLGLPKDFTALMEYVPREILAILDQGNFFQGHDRIGADERLWLPRFIRAMAAGRVDHNRHPQARVGLLDYGDAEALALRVREGLDDFVAYLVVLAAQLTRTYHRMNLDAARPLGRWSSNVASLSPEHERLHDVADEYIALINKALAQVKRLLRQEEGWVQRMGAAPSIDALLDAISNSLNLGSGKALTIDAQHLHQLTELAWLVLIEGITDHVYPGWTELLLHLSVQDPDHFGQGHKRPRWKEIGDLSEKVRGVMMPVTEQVWRSAQRLTEESAEQEENRLFYDAVATCLWAQREVTTSASQGLASSLPLPVAFVSSFDYELEMAMWRTAPEAGGDFSIVVPAYAAPHKDAVDADYIWLEGIISVPPRQVRTESSAAEREGFLAQLLTPREWRLIYTHPTQGSQNPGHFEGRPIVVRLTGSPLCRLPVLYDEGKRVASGCQILIRDLRFSGLESDKVDGDPIHRVFSHAASVDEYLALRQLAADWRWNAEDARNEQVNRGLPNCFFFDEGEKSPKRFWLILGVAFRDPAIRLRLLSTLARQRTSNRPPEGGANDHQVQVADSERASSPPKGSSGKHKKSGVRERRSSAPPASAPRDSGTEREPVLRASDGHRAVESGRELVGMAINTQIADEEAVLLNGLGLDVVVDKCETFTKDLVDYVGYLREVIRIESDGARKDGPQ